MPQQKTSVSQLAHMIDHTFLKAYGSREDVRQLCAEAIQYNFIAVCVNPAEVEAASTFLSSSSTLISTVIGFPLGQNRIPIKEYETQDAIQRGAREIDMVLNIRALQSGDSSYVRDEIETVVKACAKGHVKCKVIIETCYLNELQKREACRIASSAGADFVKTSTGFGPGGATVEDIRLMRSVIRPDMGIKASGGIRDLNTALAMIAAGASRLGTSSGVAIIRHLMDQPSSS